MSSRPKSSRHERVGRNDQRRRDQRADRQRQRRARTRPRGARDNPAEKSPKAALPSLRRRPESGPGKPRSVRARRTRDALPTARAPRASSSSRRRCAVRRGGSGRRSPPKAAPRRTASAASTIARRSPTATERRRTKGDAKALSDRRPASTVQATASGGAPTANERVLQRLWTAHRWYTIRSFLTPSMRTLIRGSPDRAGTRARRVHPVLGGFEPELAHAVAVDGTASTRGCGGATPEDQPSRAPRFKAAKLEAFADVRRERLRPASQSCSCARSGCLSSFITTWPVARRGSCA